MTRFLTAWTGLLCLSAVAAEFPVRIVADKHRAWLADRQGAPFFFNCDIAQLMLNRLRIDDVRYYLDTRKAQGYTAFWFIVGLGQAMTDDRTFVDVPPDNAYSVRPFRNSVGDLSEPDDDYFRYAKRIVDEAAARGMLAGIAPAYIGAARVPPGHPGAHATLLMKKSGAAGCLRYGEYVGSFFKDSKNVFWIHQGDQNAYNFGGRETAALVNAVAEGIRKTDTRYPRLHTAITRDIGGTVRSSSYKAQFNAAGEKVNPMPWLNVSNVYVKAGPKGDDYKQMLADQRDAWRDCRREGLPFFSLDGLCEHYLGDARGNRAQAYYSLLSGSVGYFTGNIRTCWFMSPPSSPRDWKKELTDAESVQNTYIAKLFRTLPWWKLIPDDGRLLTSGSDMCAAAKTHDGRLAAVFMPSRQSVTIDLRQLARGVVRSYWFNPRTGESEGVVEHKCETKVFIPPRRTPDDDHDWILILEAVGQRKAPLPGTRSRRRN